MALIDNPLLQTVGNQLGLGSVFSQAAQASAMKPGASRPSPSASRGNPDFAMFRYMQRMMDPHSGGEGGSPHAAMGASQGAINPQSVDDPQTQALLAKFGQSGQVQPDPNLFIHNPTAHPVMGNLLDRALTGLAYTTGNPTNPGAIMHNVAAGLLAGNQARQDQANSQMEMPFIQAQRVAGLQRDAQSLQTGRDQQAELAARTAADNARADKDERPATVPERNPEWGRESDYFTSIHNQAVAANGGKPLTDQQNQNVFDTFRKGLAQDQASGRPESPMVRLFDAAEQEYRAQNPNATSIPLSVYANAYGQKAGAVAKADAQYRPAKAPSSRDPLIGPRLSVLKQQYQDLEHKLDTVSKSYGAPIPDDSGHLLAAKTPARAAYISQLQQRQTDINNQMQQLLYSHGNETQVATPAPSSQQSNVAPPPTSVIQGMKDGQTVKDTHTGIVWKRVNGKAVQVK